MRLGLLGLGFMGSAMARNLSKKYPLMVWNRSPAKYATLKQADAVSFGETPAQVVENSDIIFVMLFDAAATQSILDADFKRALPGKIIVNTGSVSVEFSQFFDKEIRDAGGQFLEMPVSGSKVPAEEGQLVGMMAGDPDLANTIRPFVQPITRSVVYCGPIGSGLKAKYAVNTSMLILTVGLAESMSLAKAQGLDLAAFGQVLEACSIASPYSNIKISKMLNQDWSPHAALKDCYNSTQLIQSAAASANVKLPLMDKCEKLYARAMDASLGEEDVVAIAKQIWDREE
ncbi:NAD(P)-dependent oxidoreductase [Aspergillus affinis]|uniref:NAD(P)-dependent oxidoreductase n=1 Tax=Aspergillus affinis TaxID=1070780 RepID=UPI0022FE220B|nr:Glyoxylate/succinic semialdehyde reductase [Aspergillus affinis]KAI9036726.1 Glyoxylate/succinic semialdehyde reductase [Aspergillus affinis]